MVPYLSIIYMIKKKKCVTNKYIYAPLSKVNVSLVHSFLIHCDNTKVLVCLY